MRGPPSHTAICGPPPSCRSSKARDLGSFSTEPRSPQILSAMTAVSCDEIGIAMVVHRASCLFYQFCALWPQCSFPARVSEGAEACEITQGSCREAFDVRYVRLPTCQGRSSEVCGHLRSLWICSGNEKQNSVSNLRGRWQQKDAEVDRPQSSETFGPSYIGSAQPSLMTARKKRTLRLLRRPQICTRRRKIQRLNKARPENRKSFSIAARNGSLIESMR